MKTPASLIGILLIFGLFLLQASRVESVDMSARGNAHDFVYPAAVKKVIDQKCYGCHSIEGKSDDAKKSLMWDSIPSLEKGKLVATLDDIIEVLEDGTMPPEDVVKKYPEMKLLPAESKILKAWAEASADSLMK